MQTIAFMNMKGGVGKSTLAVNVAFGLAALHHQKVLIVDADPQFNTTQYLLDDDVYLAHVNDPKKGTLFDIFLPQRPGRVDTRRGIAKPVNKKKIPLENITCSIYKNKYRGSCLDLIPSSLDLMEVENSARQTEAKLKLYLKERATHYDFVIIDCPPTISIFTQAAILASDKYLVPIKPDPLSVIGLPLLERWLSDYTEDQGLGLEQVGLVFTMVRGPLPARMREVMDDLRKKRGDMVFKSHLSMATSVAESVEEHQPIFRFKKSRNGTVGTQIREIIDEFASRTMGAKK